MKRRVTTVLLACSLASAFVASGPAHAAPLLSGLGGPGGFGAGNLAANDDGSSAEIDVRAAFPGGLRFFGMTFTSLYVNNNGNVSFGGPNGTFTPEAFPVASLRMIAPWWGDVDTRGGGAPTRNGVYWSIAPGRFVATWHDVGYYNTHDDRRNDFQLILTAAGPGRGDFDVELRYNRCEWTTGDASGGSGGFGGTPAQAGFDAGNLHDYVSLPGSLTMSVLGLCDTSNVDIAGVWRFAIRDGEVTCPGVGDACVTGQPGVCAAGTMRCRSMDESVCVANAAPSDEICDGEDDDCDGSTDEELGTTVCGVGGCEVTVDNCVGGAPQTCVPGAPRPETCDGSDDDCNGAIDDLAPLRCGVGACEVMGPACAGGIVQECVPGAPAPELCNGMDDDCNGAIDDAIDACMFVPDPDAGTVSDPDAGAPLATDAGACRGWRCDPWHLSGRAGPIGCACRAAAPRAGTRSAVGVALAIVAMVLVRRRRPRA